MGSDFIFKCLKNRRGGGWKSFPHVLSWDRTDWRLVSDGWVAILLLLLLLSIASIALVDGWVGILLLQLNE